MSHILDFFGKRFSGENGSGLIDASGREIPSNLPLPGNEAVGAVAAAPAAPGKDKGAFIPSGKQIEIKGMVAMCLCVDGAFRQIALSEKEARKVFKFIKRAHNGGVRMKTEPMLIFPASAIQKAAEKKRQG